MILSSCSRVRMTYNRQGKVVDLEEVKKERRNIAFINTSTEQIHVYSYDIQYSYGIFGKNLNMYLESGDKVVLENLKQDSYRVEAVLIPEVVSTKETRTERSRRRGSVYINVGIDSNGTPVKIKKNGVLKTIKVQQVIDVAEIVAEGRLDQNAFGGDIYEIMDDYNTFMDRLRKRNK